MPWGIYPTQTKKFKVVHGNRLTLLAAAEDVLKQYSFKSISISRYQVSGYKRMFFSLRMKLYLQVRIDEQDNITLIGEMVSSFYDYGRINKYFKLLENALKTN